MADKIDWTFENLKNEDYQRPEPEKYDISDELSAALRVAAALNQPLLVTGKAGTGKTQLAYKAADEFHRVSNHEFLKAPIEFHTKSTAIARDLLYSYDAVRHFHDAGVHSAAGQKAPDAIDYIELKALGRAILLTYPDDKRGPFKGKLMERVELKKGEFQDRLIEEARSSVVLIDEVDKAPRDFPNDLLHEINRFQFEVPELTGENKWGRQGDHRIFVLLTSNSEKNLPEAFLRRCVFYNIPEPDEDRLREILAKHFKDLSGNEIARDFLLKRFAEIRKAVTGKTPATAELINWFRILSIEGMIPKLQAAGGLHELNKADQDRLKRSLSVLIKTTEDLSVALKALEAKS